MQVEIKCEHGNVTTFPVDVLVLKFAQGFYGADAAVAMSLADGPEEMARLSPPIGEYSLVPTSGKIAAKHALFVGVPDLFSFGFGYGQIRTLSKRAMEILASELPDTQHVAMTMHGVIYGLDEVEGLLSQLGGLLDAFKAGSVPPALQRITIVEIDERRVIRIQKTLSENLPTYGVRPGTRVLASTIQETSRIDEAGSKSDIKPHIFVAMPFNIDELEDAYDLAIEPSVHSAECLCERIDLTSFTGDIVERIKSRIEAAELVIANLTGANPNVYLEVGYAWGKSKRTILLIKDAEELRFDVRGQRCILYRRIADLKKALEH